MKFYEKNMNNYLCFRIHIHKFAVKKYCSLCFDNLKIKD